MWWMAIAGAAMGLIHNQAARAQIDANNRIRKANADASNTVRKASNALAAAQGGFNRYVQSVNNNRRLDAGGTNLEASVINYRRNHDALETQSFSESIRQAETAGAASAAQAAAGIDGSVVDMVNGSTALRDSIVNEQVRTAGVQMDYDAARRAGAIAAQTVQGLDGSLIMDSLDYNVDVAEIEPKMSYLAATIKGAAQGMGQNPDTIGGTTEAQSNAPKTQAIQDLQAAGQVGQDAPSRFDFNTDSNSTQTAFSLWGNSAKVTERDSLSSIFNLWSR